MSLAKLGLLSSRVTSPPWKDASTEFDIVLVELAGDFSTKGLVDRVQYLAL